jgi:hypothetical protein
MNPDLMITIVFSLWALLGWGAWVVLFVRSVRNEKAEEAATERLDAVRESAVANMQPRATRAADKRRRLSAAAGWGSRPCHGGKGRAAPRAGAGVGKR